MLPFSQVEDEFCCTWEKVENTCYSIRSMIVASPCPIPTHKVASLYFTFPRRFISYSNVVRMRAPEQPSGCPKAIAPPLTFTISELRPRSSTTAHRQVGSHLGNVLYRFAHGIRRHTYPSFWDLDTARQGPCHTRSGCQRRTPSRLWAASTERAANALEDVVGSD
jgi:hypothetical protein